MLSGHWLLVDACGVGREGKEAQEGAAPYGCCCRDGLCGTCRALMGVPAAAGRGPFVVLCLPACLPAWAHLASIGCACMRGAT